MKQHTIIFVPHAHAKFRKWRFSTLQASLTVGFLALVMIGGLIATLLFFGNNFDRAELARIEEENAQLRAVNQRFETSIREMDGRLGEYQERIQDLVIVAGLADLISDGEPGIGGLEPRSSDSLNSYDLEDLTVEIDQLAHPVSVLEGELDARRLRISSLPTIAPVRGIFSSGYGFRTDPFTGKRAFHQGLDIAAPRGHEVLAPGDAVVIKAGRAAGYGKVVYLSHDYGITTRFGHLSKIEVQAGDKVTRGQLIGRVGSTGRSTGMHLHYEVRVDGKAANPLGYILDDLSH